MKPGGRETLLIAIAKARKWVKDVERGQSFADIADREGKAERHIRHLARLAFVSPRIITAIIDGIAPAGMRGDFRGCRYFVMFRPPSLLAPQIVPTAANTPAGQPGLLRPSRTRFVTSPRIGYANRPTTGNWRYGDLHPARLRPCRLLLSSIPPIIPDGQIY